VVYQFNHLAINSLCVATNCQSGESEQASTQANDFSLLTFQTTDLSLTQCL